MWASRAAVVARSCATSAARSRSRARSLRWESEYVHMTRVPPAGGIAGAEHRGGASLVTRALAAHGEPRRARRSERAGFFLLSAERSGRCASCARYRVIEAAAARCERGARAGSLSEIDVSSSAGSRFAWELDLAQLRVLGSRRSREGYASAPDGARRSGR